MSVIGNFFIDLGENLHQLPGVEAVLVGVARRKGNLASAGRERDDATLRCARIVAGSSLLVVRNTVPTRVDDRDSQTRIALRKFRQDLLLQTDRLILGARIVARHSRRQKIVATLELHSMAAEIHHADRPAIVGQAMPTLRKAIDRCNKPFAVEIVLDLNVEAVHSQGGLEVATVLARRPDVLAVGIASTAHEQRDPVYCQIADTPTSELAGRRMRLIGSVGRLPDNRQLCGQQRSPCATKERPPGSGVPHVISFCGRMATAASSCFRIEFAALACCAPVFGALLRRLFCLLKPVTPGTLPSLQTT